MKFISLLFLYAFLLYAEGIHAQGQANNWYFGENAGLNFNGGSPVALNDGQSTGWEGTAVMSDSAGNLLFYTDGATVWNRNHDTLQNGFGLLGEQSSTQSALIIQKPGSNNIYYIFTTSQAQRFEDWVFCYSELDINLDGGLGGITTNKNVQLFEPIGEKITAVKHANNQDIWVLSHDKYTNKYLVYSITSAGVNATPIIFAGGSIDNGVESFGVNYFSPNFGQLKASTDGTRIACAFSKVNKVDVLDFNKATGQLTFKFTISQVVNPYGIEFSPNGSLLYVTGYNPSTMWQYDLSLTSPAAIISNVYSFPNINPYSPMALQLGPDEKIYVANVVGEFSDCIQNPNEVGSNCNYLTNAVSLNGASAWLGLPNFAPYYLVPSGIDHTGNCENDTTFFSFSIAIQADSVHWNFGDSTPGNLNFSNNIAPFHIYQHPGTYNVTVTYFQGGQSITIDKPVTILTIPNISLGADTIFCNGTLAILNVEGFNLGYNYSFSSGIFNNSFTSTPVFASGLTGEHWITVSNSCGISSDTIQIAEVFPPEQFSLQGDLALCEGTSYFIGTSPAVGNYLWQDGSTDPIFMLSEVGEYFVTVSNECGSQSDTMFVTAIIPLPSANLGNDTSICAGNSLLLYPEGDFDFFTWENPSLFGAVWVTETSTFSITAYNGCGMVWDTIRIVVDSLPPAPIDFGANVSLCEGLSITLSIGQQGLTYLWQDGSTDSLLTVTQSGLFYGAAINGCGVESDTVIIQTIPLPTVSLGSDTTICIGDSLDLSAVGIADTYLWQDGSINPDFIVMQPGIYAVLVGNQCGTATDTVFVNQNSLPTVSLGADTAICLGSQIQLNAVGTANTYLWQDGSMNPFFIATASGVYSVSATNSCGVISDTIQVSTISPPSVVNLGNDTSICFGTQLLLDATQNNVVYQWQDASANPQWIASQAGTYHVQVSNNCGFESDSINISVNPLPSVTLGPDISNCNGSAVQINAIGVADAYLWQDGSNLQSFTTINSGSYFVLVSNSCGTSSDTISVSINLPTTSFIYKNECGPFSLNGLTYNTSGQFTQVIPNSNGCDSIITIDASIANLDAQIFQTDSTLYFSFSSDSFQWINCDAKVAVDGATQASFTPLITGNYAVVVTNGTCMDTSNCIQMIKAVAEPSLNTLCQDLIIFPNPIHDNIEFQLNKSDYPIRIFNSSGALLQSSYGNLQKQIIFLENLAPAMYILQVDECRYKMIKN